MRGHLERQVALERFLHVLADAQLVQVLQVRQALEEEDARDQRVGMLHLVDRLVVLVVAELRIAPVPEHAGVQEVLVDRGELVGQHRVEVAKHLGIAAHGTLR